jgi:3-hydroxyacyl-[acyl-carrier-protein] dehydratase
MRFLLLDRITELVPGKYAVGVKTPTMSEDYFADHFPAFPVVPGVLLVESMAQLSGRLISYTVKAESGRSVLPVLLTVNNARFRRFVRPGDSVIIRAELAALAEDAGKCKATATVNNTAVASAELMLGFDAQQTSVIPADARERIDRWAEEINRSLLLGCTIVEPSHTTGNPLPHVAEVVQR